MMKLSIMEKVVATVDKNWRSPIAEKILENWGFDEGQVYYVRASANFIFYFKREDKSYFLRFSDASEKDKQLLEAEVEILKFLGRQTTNIALPVQSQKQKWIETVETEIGTFHAIVFEALPGKHIETEELTDEQAYNWGKSLGNLHYQLKQVPKGIRNNRPSWKDQLVKVQASLPEFESAAIRELELIKKWSDNIVQTDDNFGLIHYDFELDNLKWNEESVGILDFDDMVNHWYVADIAYALRDYFKGGIDLEHKNVQQFINGYSSQTDIDSQLLENLEWFMRMHNLITFTNLLNTVDLPDSSSNPKWLTDLRDKLLGFVAYYRNMF